MAFLGATLSGTVTRSPETIKSHRLVRDGHAKYDEFKARVDKDAEEILAAQQKGFAFVSGGQLDWLDLMRPLAHSWTGFAKRQSEGEDAIGPVTRWFRTNTFYRKPSVSGKLECGGSEIADWLPKVEGNGIVFLQGPYTFFRLAEHSHYKSGQEFADDYAEAIVKSSMALKAKGYSAVLFSENSVGYDLSLKRLDEKLWAEDFAEKAKKGGLKVGVNFPLADASKVLHLAEGTAFDFAGIDASFTDFAQVKTSKDILLGAADGQRIGVEMPEHMAKIAREFEKSAKFSGDYFIGPNDRLFDVPFEQGIEKIKSLAGAAKILGRGGN
ncbi:MAG: hypothetical protein HY394_04655 [Candidatus Diapherotrites archaeon]|nr:hypothetical protein [Candidatus Diapherotrites archaeon]